MMQNKSYRVALGSAIFLHALLLLALVINPESSRRPVLQQEAKRDVTPSESKHVEKKDEEPKIVHAVSVNAKEVQEAVTRLKTARAEERRGLTHVRRTGYPPPQRSELRRQTPPPSALRAP